MGDNCCILVVVDRLSKYATFIPTPKSCSAKKTAGLFKYVVKYWGVPQNIVSDQDSRFTGTFWGLNERSPLAITHKLMAKTEQFNVLLEESLRHFVNANRVQLLDVAKLCFHS